MVSLRLTPAELGLLTDLLLAAPAAPPAPAGDPGGAWASLVARGLAAPGAGDAVRLDHTVLALLGTCLRPESALHLTVSDTGEAAAAGAAGAAAAAGAPETFEATYYHLAGTTIEHAVALEGGTAGSEVHVFTAWPSFAHLLEHLQGVLGLAGQVRPTAGRAPDGPRRLSRLEAFATPSAGADSPGGGPLRSLGTLLLVEDAAGLWAIVAPGPAAGGAGALDVRPPSATEAGAALASMGAALGWTAPRPGAPAPNVPGPAGPAGPPDLPGPPG